MSILAYGARRRSAVPFSRAIVWQDNFDRADLGPDWGILLRSTGRSNGEEQAYVNDSRTVRLQDGLLVIEAHKEQFDATTAWISGRIDTNARHAFHYGRLEARMRSTIGQGTWPAFWTEGWTLGAPTPNDGGTKETGVGLVWPYCGEIDIMEALNSDTYVHSAVHVSGADRSSVSGSGIDRTQWHIYAVEWTPDSLVFSVDGVNYYTLDITDSIFNTLRQPHFLILNMAMGGWAGSTTVATPDPATLFVDWVRVLAPEPYAIAVVPLAISITESVILSVGNKTYLNPVITPVDAHDKGTFWETSNPAVAVVGGGYVTAVAQGTANITATTWNGRTDTCTVTVT